MSVAFRRESDDEHLEPTFELPLPPGPNLVTERGLALIGERVAALEAEIASADVEAAKPLRRELRYWQTRRATAIVTMPRADGVVGFGTSIRFTLAGKERSVTLVGDDEADPAAALLSFNSPLGRALLGAEAGDVLPFNDREEAIEVIDVG